MILPTLDFEKKLWAKECRLIAGFDEVGRGAWAGPLVAGAVILPPDENLLRHLIEAGVRDSKALSSKKRLFLAKAIGAAAIHSSIATSTETVIDRRGISFATQTALRKAFRALSPTPEHILVDGFNIRYIPKKFQTRIIKGDQICLSVAAASILAKVYRDQLMVEKYHRLYPQYEFHRHKGYGTQVHQQKIATYGLCPIHRVSFVPTDSAVSR